MFDRTADTVLLSGVAKTSPDVALRANIIDGQHFKLGEVQALTDLGRGSVEGYIRRGVVKVSAVGQGKGRHTLFSGRDVLKIAAVATLVKAKSTPEYAAWIVADSAPSRFDLTTKEPLEYSPTMFRELVDRFVKEGATEAFLAEAPLMVGLVKAASSYVGGMDMGGLWRLNDGIAGQAEHSRKVGDVAYTVFDAPMLIAHGYDIMQAYLDQRSEGV